MGQGGGAEEGEDEMGGLDTFCPDLTTWPAPLWAPSLLQLSGGFVGTDSFYFWLRVFLLIF